MDILNNTQKHKPTKNDKKELLFFKRYQKGGRKTSYKLGERWGESDTVMRLFNLEKTLSYLSSQYIENSKSYGPTWLQVEHASYKEEGRMGHGVEPQASTTPSKGDLLTPYDPVIPLPWS